jgi:hypothetical protein
LRTIWIVLTPLSAIGLCCVLVAKKYTLKRNFVKAGERPSSRGITEGGQQNKGSKEMGKLEDGTTEVGTASDNVSMAKVGEM